LGLLGDVKCQGHVMFLGVLDTFAFLSPFVFCNLYTHAEGRKERREEKKEKQVQGHD
jgi:hypothetical protein